MKVLIRRLLRDLVFCHHLTLMRPLLFNTITLHLVLAQLIPPRAHLERKKRRELTRIIETRVYQEASNLNNTKIAESRPRGKKEGEKTMGKCIGESHDLAMLPRRGATNQKSKHHAPQAPRPIHPRTKDIKKAAHLHAQGSVALREPRCLRSKAISHQWYQVIRCERKVK